MVRSFHKTNVLMRVGIVYFITFLFLLLFLYFLPEEVYKILQKIAFTKEQELYLYLQNFRNNQYNNKKMKYLPNIYYEYISLYFWENSFQMFIICFFCRTCRLYNVNIAFKYLYIYNFGIIAHSS